MKLSRRHVVLALFAIVLIGGIVVFRAMHGSRVARHEAHKKDVYYCPMHPTYTSDRPGDCPICNMKLVKREQARKEQPKEHAGHGEMTGMESHAAVSITPQKKQLIGVKTTTATKSQLTKTIRTVGQIAYDPELYQAQQEYLQAAAALSAMERGGSANPFGGEAALQGTHPETLEQAKRLVEAASMRLRLLGLSEAFIQKMRGWKQPDQALLLSDPQGRVWLYAPIYEFELPLIRVGQKVQVEIPSIPGKILEGTIESVDAVLDPMTRSARVRALLIDPEKILRPQMYVNASLIVPVGQVLSVPVEAVMDSGARKILFVEKEEGLFEPRDVVVGVRADEGYEIKEGLQEGEKVVVSGNFLIDSESRLKSALEKSASGGEHQHAH